MTTRQRTRARRVSLTERLRRHQLATGAVIALVAAALAAVAFRSTNGIPFLPGYTVHTTLPAGTPSVVPGTDVRVAGLYAGTVTSVTTTADHRQLLQLSIRIHPIGRNARLTLRSKSPAGNSYLALQRGNYLQEPLATGGVIPSAADAYVESLPEVIAGFRRSALNDLGLSIRLAGAGVLGRGLDLNRALDGVGSTVGDTAALLRALTPGSDLTTLTRDAGVTVRALQGQGPDDAGRLATAAANLFGDLSDPGSRLGAAIDALPPFEHAALGSLPQLDPVLSGITRLAPRLRPAIGALARALPSLSALLRSGTILSETVPPLVRAGDPALRALAPALQALWPSAELLNEALPAVSTIVSYLAAFPQEIQDGLAAYYLVDLYHPAVGQGAGYPAAPIIPVLACAPGYNAHPTPGSVFTDHTDGSCG